MTTTSELSVFDGNRPSRPGDLTLETAGMVPIPEDARYGANWRNFTVWFAPNMELSGVFTGTLAATLGLGLWTGLAAIFIGVVLGALPVAALALWGPKTGMAQLPLARLPFGKSIAIPALVQWLSAVAWDGLVGLFGGEAAQLLFHVPFAVGVLVVLAVEGLIGFLGYEFVHRLQAWGAWVLAVLFAVLTYKVVERGHFPVHGTVHGGAAVGTFLLMMTIAFSGGFSWATYAADYSRYMATDTPRRPLFWFTFAGLAGSFVWVYTIGLLGARSLGDQTAAGVQALMGGGVLGYLALVAVSFGAVTSNAMNDYSGSLAVQAGGVRIKRHISAAFGTLIAFFLILWLHTGDLSAKFQNVLLFTAYWIAPFLAVLVIDWRERKSTVDRRTLVHMLRWQNLASGWPALLALVVGFGAMVPFMDTGLLVGPAANALDGADVSFAVGFVVAACVYYPLRRLAAQPSVPAAPEAAPETASETAPEADPDRPNPSGPDRPEVTV
ncbi:MAG: purine-cytosine permease family protein [Acidimicrobiales bacterium]